MVTLNKFKESKELFDKAYDIFMKLLGPDDSMTKQVAKYVSSVGLYVEYLKDNNNNNNKKLKKKSKTKTKAAPVNNIATTSTSTTKMVKIKEKQYSTSIKSRNC